jgi:replication-associated recombination protein RarA
VEKYQPRIRGFVGLSEPKQIFLGLLRRPRPCNLLLIGGAGVGKTAMLNSFAEELPAEHHHIPSAECTADELDRIWYRCHTYPGRGCFHLVHVSEADTMTEKAQELLYSRMDGSAALRPTFGGGYERGEPLPIIHAFTCNGRMAGGVMHPPVELQLRFVSRCIQLMFEPVPAREMARYLQKVWRKEKGRPGMPLGWFEYLAEGVAMRDALNRVESELLMDRTVGQVQTILRERLEAAVAKTNGEAAKWEAATEVDNDPEVRDAIAKYEDAVARKMDPMTIAAKKGWVSVKRDAARQRLEA